MGIEEGQVRRGRGRTQVSSLQCEDAEPRTQTVKEIKSENLSTQYVHCVVLITISSLYWIKINYLVDTVSAQQEVASSIPGSHTLCFTTAGQKHILQLHNVTIVLPRPLIFSFCRITARRHTAQPGRVPGWKSTTGPSKGPIDARPRRPDRKKHFSGGTNLWTCGAAAAE